MKRVCAVALFCLIILLATALLHAFPSPSQPGLALNFFSMVVDEQTSVGCPNPPLQTPAYLTGDITADPSAVGPTSAYTVAPWPTPFTSLTSVAYVNGDDCSSSGRGCVAVNFNHNQTVLSLDSRGSQDPTTGRPRALRLDFGQPCAYCAYGPGPANPFGTNPVSTPGLLSIFLTTPYTSMQICSSTDCPESETGTVRFWFNDPSGSSDSWRLDWGFVRVLRISNNTWYAVADTCDGSQVATLYKIKRKSSQSRQGQYLMPFFVSGGQ